MNNYEMPVGFGMALAMNSRAMEKFSSMSEEKKKQILDQVKSVRSKEEMRSYVEGILDINE